MKYITTINNDVDIRTVSLDVEDSFSKEIEQETDEVYFRDKLSSSIKLKGADYDFIYNSDSQTKFLLNITQTLTENGIPESIDYFNGYFTKLDCEFNNDDKIVEITVSSNDMYEDLLLGIDDEYDLIKLAPPTKRVQYFKRPIVQVYRYGDNKLASFIGGTYWEEDCKETTDASFLTLTCRFGKLFMDYELTISGDGYIPEIKGVYYGIMRKKPHPTNTNPSAIYYQEYLYSKTTNYKLQITVEGLFSYYYRWIKVYDNNNTLLYAGEGQITNEADSTTKSIDRVNGAVQDFFNVAFKIDLFRCRWLMDNNIGFTRSSSDITEYNPNYRYVKPYNLDNIYPSINISSTPTEYGKLPDNSGYYQEPDLLGYRYYPISRSTWVNFSKWFRFDSTYLAEETSYRQSTILKDAYTLEDTIQVLLDKILGSRKITFANNTDHSIFFYNNNPFLRPVGKPIYYPILTPKSNILKGEYDKPAQKAPITLKEIFEMLKTVFNCYWELEKVGNDIYLRIEHISYFQNGGSYDLNASTIGVDLTTQYNTKSQRPYAVKMADYISGKDYPINANKWKYDKSDLPTRTEYSWMDNSSEAFNGYPIVVNSPNVTKGKIDKIQSAKFTTDIDMMVSTSEEFSSDGFALMGAEIVYDQSYQYKLPIINIQANRMNLYLQNGYLSYVYLHPNYFKHNAPAPNITINESETQAVTTIKTKVQEVEYPYIYDLDYKKIIRTGIGDGVIEKISVNLSSRNNIVTLKFNED